MQIITGKTGTNHVTAEDDRALHAATFGAGNYVLDVGSKFAAIIETSNNIAVADGALMMNGTLARIRYGETETVVIENGTTGYNRIDLIVARFQKKSGIDSMEMTVIKGETVSGTPSQPEYTEGNILEGAELADFPIYAVELEGVNIVSITPLFDVLDNDFSKSANKKDILDAVYPIGAIYMSVNNANPSGLFGGTWVAWGSGKVPVGVDSSQTEFATVEKTGGAKTHTLTISEMPEHDHDVKRFNILSGESNTMLDTTSTNISTFEGNALSGKLGKTGGSQPHNNLQPYITCYMWKRTA